MSLKDPIGHLQYDFLDIGSYYVQNSSINLTGASKPSVLVCQAEFRTRWEAYEPSLYISEGRRDVQARCVCCSLPHCQCGVG